MARAALIALLLVAGCGGGDHPTGIRVLGLTPGACGAGGSVLYGKVPLRLEPEGFGAFVSVSVRVVVGGSVAPLAAASPPFVVELDTLQLADGTARLALSAEDSGGESLGREIDVCVDNHGPDLSVLSPAAGAVIGIEDAKVAVRVSADDPAGVASVTARLSTAGAHQQVDCQPPEAKEQVCTLRPGELGLLYEPSAKSEITLTVTARDKVGHERSVKRQLEVGTRLRWRYATGAPISWGAVVTSTGLVVVGTDTGALHVLDTQGKPVCKFQAPPVSGQSDPITTPLTLAEVGAAAHVFMATQQTLWDINPETCAVRWSNPGGLYFGSKPAFDATNDLLFIGCYGEVATAGALRSFRASTGKALGSLPIAAINGTVTGSPAIAADGKTVFIGSSDLNVYAADASAPSALKELWKFGAGGAVNTLPLVTPTTVYVASLAKTLHALSPSTGTAVPGFSFSAEAGFQSSPVLGADGLVYVGSLDEMLYALDAAGKAVATFQTGRMQYGTPAVGPGGIVYAAGMKTGRLFALSSKLELLWSTKPGSADTDELKASPVVAGGSVYIGSSNGFLYAFDATPPAN